MTQINNTHFAMKLFFVFLMFHVTTSYQFIGQTPCNYAFTSFHSNSFNLFGRDLTENVILSKNETVPNTIYYKDNAFILNSTKYSEHCTLNVIILMKMIFDIF